MAQKKTTPGAETSETAPTSEAFKEGVEKTVKGYDQLLTIGKENAEAVLQSANAAGKGIETINQEVLAYARRSVEDSVAAAKAVLSAKSFEEAIQLQTEFGKAAFETYVDHLAKFGDMAFATARNAAEPLQSRFAAMTDIVRAA